MSTVASAKLRSCVVCRARKVKCDKRSPCSNCLRGNIACVLPSVDRPPRWARRMERVAHTAAASALASPSASTPLPSEPPAPAGSGAEHQQVLDRLRTLEGLVQELSSHLQQTQQTQQTADRSVPRADSVVPTTETSPREPLPRGDSASPSSNASSMPRDFGRLVLQDPHRSRYISSGFWSRINDELDAIKIQTASMAGDDSDSSQDEYSSPPARATTLEQGRPAAERNAFLFRHNLHPAGLNSAELHPLPSQVPFLLSVYSDNVGLFTQVVHMPSVSKLVSDTRAGGAALTPPNEALLFAIYYAACTSMEEEDVLTNFGRPKAELNLKFRLGFEHAMAKADFLNEPNMVLVQALVIFLCLARRHDSPRFVWMMTGLAIRMAQALGLQRDGSHFSHLSPYEIEMRRRVWWSLCMLDSRASEDQGTDVTIGSFDTKMPANINDGDIEPGSSEAPVAREGITDMTFAIVWIETDQIMRQMISLGPKEDGSPNMEQQSRLLEELYGNFEKNYFRYVTDPNDITRWVGLTIARLVMAKMSLFIHHPVLFSPPSETFSIEVRTKLLVNAIEVAEYNHALNSEEACRHWRWVYQTYTHWPSIVYLLIEIARRPWGPLIERAWVALHSPWLIPTTNPAAPGQNAQFWVPLRKLMVRARRHRAAELARLGEDPTAVEELETKDRESPQPGSSGSYPPGADVVALCRERWRRLVSDTGSHPFNAETKEADTAAPTRSSPSEPHCGGVDGAAPIIAHPHTGYPGHPGSEAVGWTGHDPFTADALQSHDALSASDPLPWLWTDTDMLTDMHDAGAGDWMDWQDWVVSANTLTSGGGRDM